MSKQQSTATDIYNIKKTDILISPALSNFHFLSFFCSQERNRTSLQGATRHP